MNFNPLIDSQIKIRKFLSIVSFARHKLSNSARLCSLVYLVNLMLIKPAVAIENDLKLTVKPKLCVLSNERQSCKDKLVISWQSQSARSLCLFSNQKTSSLACWTDSFSGETEQLIQTQETLKFYLKQAERIVAEKNLDVIKTFASRSNRNRNRHPWSLF